MGSLAEEDRVDEVGADVAVVEGEVGAQVGLVGREPAEEEADQLELVDVFGRVAGAVWGRRRRLGQDPVVGRAAGQLERVAVIRAVRVAVAGVAVGVVGRGGEGFAADCDVSGCGIRSFVDLDEVGVVESFPALRDGAVVCYRVCELGERVHGIWRWDCCNR